LLARDTGLDFLDFLTDRLEGGLGVPRILRKRPWSTGGQRDREHEAGGLGE